MDSPDPLEARFGCLRGIAADPDGHVYVADEGNHVIRVIDRAGPVTTLAGTPRQPGSGDGVGDGAEFRELKGLACGAAQGRQGTLYVLDRHAVRAVSFPEGVVETVIGQVDTPGFQDVLPGGPLRDPCLNDPAGIRWSGGLLYIADTGNHAVRVADLKAGILHTLVGDPGQVLPRPGLLRDGIPGPLDEGYGALGWPTAVAPAGGVRGPGGTLLVCDTQAVVKVRDPGADPAWVEASRAVVPVLSGACPP
jgi:hypothetical protein